MGAVSAYDRTARHTLILRLFSLRTGFGQGQLNAAPTAGLERSKAAAEFKLVNVRSPDQGSRVEPELPVRR
jgi:hypothetical protein